LMHRVVWSTPFRCFGGDLPMQPARVTSLLGFRFVERFPVFVESAHFERFL